MLVVRRPQRGYRVAFESVRVSWASRIIRSNSLGESVAALKAVPGSMQAFLAASRAAFTPCLLRNSRALALLPVNCALSGFDLARDRAELSPTVSSSANAAKVNDIASFGHCITTVAFRLVLPQQSQVLTASSVPSAL